MRLELRNDQWWIVNTPEGVDEMGPYGTKAEATSHMKGVERFLDNPTRISMEAKRG